ncbi:hypothetical protein HS1genome_0370 [Sulfodiicoccus acidiphilus]|uniref:DNA-directed RNA polymerase subunit Rpo8 n=1 Tax=Sulfodiicoccus acidiphilus TaxID=1670455 RepID=A0A348B1C9_9CREN|nr:DNA-directed RNA polymerase subunit G [Sulfodiicoccus acidiphilus]BBD71981.1 hypothetical protein HS1genome_0370 [Sulfodiicoccus acidiphilus]GGT91907.1 hypothetical protein GCM10007116_07080 [Sulfodiicoccus acidiphilus]
MSVSQQGSLKLSGAVVDKKPGQIPGAWIARVESQGTTVELDVLREFDLFREGSKVVVELSKSRPDFSAEDFCAHGYLFSEKENNGKRVTLLSLYGLIVRFTTDDGLISSGKFSMMDHVYLCVRPSA